MPYTLNEKQQSFVDAYRERFEIDLDFGDEIVINRAISALAAIQFENQSYNIANCEELINGAIGAWCKKYKIQRGAHLLRGNDCWLIEDEFSFDDPVIDVFPALYQSFQQFLKAYGFQVDEQSYGCYSISKFRFD